MTITGRRDNWQPELLAGRVREPKRTETISTTTRSEMQRRDRVKVIVDPVFNIPDAVTTTVNWDAELFDEPGMHNSTNPDRITVYQADSGAFAWHISAQIFWDNFGVAAATTSIVVSIVKNGTTSVASVAVPPNPDGSAVQHLSTIVNDVIPGDYFIVAVTQNSGGAIDILSDSFFQIVALW